MFVGGPWDSRTMKVIDPQSIYYAIQEPDPFDNFRRADSVIPGKDTLSQRITYEKVDGTVDPVIYRCKDIDRAQEVVNLCRRIGIVLKPWQERMMRQWMTK
jgi:hypothetical protein